MTHQLTPVCAGIGPLVRPLPLAPLETINSYGTPNTLSPTE